MVNPSRRAILVGAASLIGATWAPLGAMAQEAFDPDQTYAAVSGEPFPVAAIDLRRVRPQFVRTVVPYESSEAPGTIIIDPARHFLYVVNGDGRAIRYGVGVGRQGFLWSGEAHIQAKREWPDWYPPKEMLARDPHTRAAVTTLQGGLGMPGGVGNPLGARAMYLYQGGKDTLYRIHGTIEPYSIGSSVSSGCIRMMNQDILDLYSRIPIGTKVIVLGDAHPDAQMAKRQRVPDDANDDATQPEQARAQYVDPGQDRAGYSYGYQDPNQDQ